MELLRPAGGACEEGEVDGWTDEQWSRGAGGLRGAAKAKGTEAPGVQGGGEWGTWALVQTLPTSWASHMTFRAESPHPSNAKAAL